MQALVSDWRRRLHSVLSGSLAEKSAKQAAVVSLFAWFAVALLLDSILLGLLSAIALLPVVFSALLYCPVLKGRNYGKRVEAQLPFVLLNIAIELNLGLDFMLCLRNAARHRSEAGREFRKVVAAVQQHGATVQEALLLCAERVNSRLLNRAVSQLVAVFEQGSRRNAGEPIKRIAAEILTRQRIESKVFSGKLVVLSLLFIAVSAIIPALFQSFVAAGSVVLRLSFTALQVLLIITVLFPLLDLFVLFYIRGKTPVFMRG